MGWVYTQEVEETLRTHTHSHTSPHTHMHTHTTLTHACGEGFCGTEQTLEGLLRSLFVLSSFFPQQE